MHNRLANTIRIFLLCVAWGTFAFLLLWDFCGLTKCRINPISLPVFFTIGLILAIFTSWVLRMNHQNRMQDTQVQINDINSRSDLNSKTSVEGMNAQTDALSPQSRTNNTITYKKRPSVASTLTIAIGLPICLWLIATTIFYALPYSAWKESTEALINEAGGGIISTLAIIIFAIPSTAYATYLRYFRDYPEE